MAACGVAFVAASDCRGFLRVRREGYFKQIGAPWGSSNPRRADRPVQIRCFSGGKTASELLSGEDVIQGAGSDDNFDLRDLGPVTRFRMSDFSLCNQVSIGLAGKGDELIFEAIVKDRDSPLYQSRVVLRQLMSNQAQRRGRRALEVLKKLSRRQLMYHSYAMQVHGYMYHPDSEDHGSFTLVHGYHGSYSLKHWLQLSDWLPTLEATLALDEEWVRRVGDDRVGGPAVTRQQRIIRIVMRDLLIGVNYLHSHGLAHTQLRLENLHICPVARHVKVGILGNAVDFHDSTLNSTADAQTDRRQLMIAFDVRCLGFIMAKMVLRELMNPAVFTRFKSFLTKGNDPSCLREHLLPILCRNSPTGNSGLQMLDRQWGAGWNLLSLLLAPKPSERISCLDALRHPFLCGPRWRVEPSPSIVRWGLGSTVVKISEEYIYGQRQRTRLAHFIELMEMMNPHTNPADWEELLPGRWRLLYSTGRHVGLTLRQTPSRVLIGDAFLTFEVSPRGRAANFSAASDVAFKALPMNEWPHDKSGVNGRLRATAVSVRLMQGRRLFLHEADPPQSAAKPSSRELLERRWTKKNDKRKMGTGQEMPLSLPAAQIVAGDAELELSFASSPPPSVDLAKAALREVRIQIPPEMFDPSRIVCGTYLDSRLLVLRGVDGSALLFSRSPYIT